MRHSLNNFDKAFLFFALLMQFAGAFHIISNSGNDTSDKLVLLGFWVIISFIMLNLAFGISKGIPRTKIKIAKKPAIVSFIIGGALMVTGIFKSAGI